MELPDQNNIDDRSAPDGSGETVDVASAIGKLAPRARALNSLQLIMDSHLLVSVTDEAGRITFANDRLCIVSQFDRSELLGRTHEIMRSQAHSDDFFRAIWTNISSGQIWSGEIENLAKDGTAFLSHVTISPVFDEKGEIAGYCSIMSDAMASVDGKTAAADDERRRFDTLQQALDVMETAITVISPDGKIIVANKAHRTMYPDRADVKRAGYTLRDIIRAAKPGRDEKEVEEIYESLQSTGAVELRHLDDGRQIQFERTLLPDGGFVSLHTDITQIMENSEKLERQAAAMDLMMAIAVDANESVDTDTAYTACLKRICQFADWQVGHTYLINEGEENVCHSGKSWYSINEEQFKPFREVSDGIQYETGVGLPGTALELDGPAWIYDVTVREDFPRAKPAEKCGLIGGAAFPVRVRNKIVAVLEFFATRPLEPSEGLSEIMSHVCTQVGRVAEREMSERQLKYRVNQELEKRDRELIEQNQRFDLALKHMSQGLCMYDKNKRLIVANHRYSEMYGLPAEIMKPGISLREIIQNRIDNGIYSGDSPEDYIEERMKWVSSGVQQNKIQELSDGRVVAITHQPMDDGGWLTTHEDITERVLSEKTLQETQELFSTAFRASPAAIAISNPKDGSHFDVNEAWCSMLGYTREDALANSALELGLWEQPEVRAMFVEHIARDGSMKGLEAVFRTKDGNLIDVIISGEQLEIGGRQRLLVASYDITERKKAETALRDSQERFRSLVESTNVAPWEFDPAAMRFTYVGPQVTDMFGYPAEDWLKENFWKNIIHPDDLEYALKTCADATAKCLDHDFEYRIVTADGQEKWVRDVVSVISEDGKATGLRGVLIDVSERVRARHALEASEQRFKDIVEISSDWIWECDSDLRFTYVSERFSEAAGVPVETILGKTRKELGHGSCVNWESHLKDLEMRRPFRNFCYSVEGIDGRRHWSVSGRPIYDTGGEFKGYRGTGFDRTSAVLAEKELIRHRDHLQDLVKEATSQLKLRADELKKALAKEKELNELQRQFISMASHEFRTPLAIIDSAAQRLLRRGDGTDSVKIDNKIENIRKAVGRMTQLMESTLAAARLEDGKNNLKLETLDVTSLACQVCEQQQEIAQNHTIECKINGLPLPITADQAALEQVFSNLLSNAVKYSPENGKIDVSCSSDDQEFIFSVRDYGVGIDPDELPKMFHRFFRARTSTGIAGTGIGLNLVKTLIELHEGTISVESIPGEGSTFTVRLPIDGPKAAQNGDIQAA